jgi:hypothetical protein
MPKSLIQSKKDLEKILAADKARKKRIAEKKELKEVHNYIRKNMSFLPFDSYLSANPIFHHELADGNYALITLTGSSSDPVSALECLARDAMRKKCEFVSVNNTVILQTGIKQELLGFDYVRGSDVYRTVPVPPNVTYFATGFYRKKPKSK